MADDKYVELIHKELDGTISYFERARLNRYLRTDSEARKLREDLTQMEEALYQVEPVEAPAAIRQNVMAGIQPRVPQAVRRRNPVVAMIESVAGRLRAQPAYAVGLGFALGVLVIVPFAVQSDGLRGIHNYEVSGTLVPGVIPRSLTPVDHIDLQGEGLKGEFETHTAEGLVLAGLAISAAQPVVVQVTFDPRYEHFTGLVNESLTATYVNSEDNRVTLRHSGDEEYWFLFSAKSGSASQIDIKVLSGAEVVFVGAVATQTNTP
jgi:hypothetical protein